MSMRRRVFVTGSLLAAAGAAAAVWRERFGLDPLRGEAPGRGGGEPLPDGRRLVRGAALAFGTTVSITAVHGDPDAARAAIEEALRGIRRIDALMTVFRPGSEVSRLNAQGALRRPDPHLVRLLEFSQRLSALSDGSFDVTVQPLWTLFVSCARERRLPARSEIERARSLVGFEGLDVSTRRLSLRPGMSITLNGIAQGYAADLASGVLRERGVHDALVDAGEYGAEGARQPGRPWTVGLQDPRDPSAILGAVAMDGRFLATSGDYEMPFSDDRLYHHIFDPHTGVSPTRWSSVVVAAATGLEADGLTKPMMVLPPERAQALLSRFPGAGAVFVAKDGRVAASRNVPFTPAAPQAGTPSRSPAPRGDPT
jgi:FAD:protein FMN transferase